MAVYALILIVLVIGLYVVCYYMPTKKTMSEIYQEMYRKQNETNKTVKDIRNMLFSKSRKKERKNG